MSEILLKLKLSSDNQSGELLNMSIGEEMVSDIPNTSIKPNSQGVYENVNKHQISGSNGICFAEENGESVIGFNDSDFLCDFDNEDGVLEDDNVKTEYLFGLTNSNKEYNLTLNFNFSDATIDKITIYGDTASNQFATEAYLDGDSSKIVYSDDAQWSILFNEKASSHSITFTKWNRKNYNACITAVDVFLSYLTINGDHIKNIESLSQSQSDASDIQYGLLANTGKISILDDDGELLDLINDGIMPDSNISVDIIINNSSDVNVGVQNHITDDTNYSDGIMDFSLTNQLSSLKNKMYNGNNQKIMKDLNGLQLISDIYTNSDISNSTIDYKLFLQMPSNVLIPSTTYLSLISFKNIYLNDGDYFNDLVNKFSNATQLNFFINNQLATRIEPARPIIPKFEAESSTSTNYQRPKLILSNNIFEDSGISKIKKNKFKQVKIKTLKTTENIDVLNTNLIKNFSGSAPSEIGYEYANIDAINQANEYLSHRSYYTSDEITSDNIVENDNYQEYTDNNNNLWYIYTKTISNDYYTKIEKKQHLVTREYYNPVTKEIIQLQGNYGYMTTESCFSTTNGGNPSLNFYALNYENYFPEVSECISNIDDVKARIEELSNSLQSSQNAVLTFILGDKDTIVIDQTTGMPIGMNYGKNIFNYYQKEYTIAVAIKSNSSHYGFPCRFWMTSTFPIQSEGYSAETKKIYRKSQEYVEHIYTKPEYEGEIIDENDIVTFEENPLLTEESEIQVNTTGFKYKLYDYIAKNILYDYRDGIYTKTIKVACGDYNYMNGAPAYKWENGEIFNVGDVVVIPYDKYQNGEYIYWKITGKKLIYDESDLYLQLELQEVRKSQDLIVDEFAGLISYSRFFSWDELIEIGDITLYYNEIDNTNKSMSGILTIKNGITSLGYRAFRNSDLKSINMPNSVTSIGQECFEGADELTNINMSENIETIGNFAFSGCDSIQYNEYNNANYLGNKNNNYIVLIGPKNKTSIESFDILKQTRIICYNAFYGSTIKNIIIPKNIVSIGNNAFRDCNNLETIEFENGSKLKYIGESAFYGCKKISNIIIPNTVKTINRLAFANCYDSSNLTGLKVVSIESNSQLTMIDISAFSGCRLLEEITIPFVGKELNGTQYTHFGYIFGANSISEHQNNVPSSLKTVIITGGTSIGGSAFAFCSDLTSITIPNSVTSIGGSAFYGCSSLSNIIFKDVNGWSFNGNPIDVSNPQINATNLKTNGIWIGGISKTN